MEVNKVADIEVDMVADMEVDMVVNVEVDMVANVEVDMVADININIDINSNINIQFGESWSRVMDNWAQTFFYPKLYPACAASMLCGLFHPKGKC